MINNTNRLSCYPPVLLSFCPMTPMLFRRFKSPSTLFLRSFASQEIISVENKRLQNSIDGAPTFLPPSDFPYDYKPMSVFEEQIGTKHNHSHPYNHNSLFYFFCL